MRSSWSFRSTVGWAAALAVLSAHVFAQSPSPEPASPETAAPSEPRAEASETVEEVVVRGQRMDEIEFDIRTYIRNFVAQVVALPPGGGYARWQGDVCIGVHNLETSAAQYIADRISLQAAEVGLEPGEPGCEPDVMIIFTTEAQEVASHLVENQPRLFRPGGGTCCMQLGLAALDEFAESDRAVRWWHVSMPVDARTGQRAIVLPQDSQEYPVISVAGPSRLHSGIRDDMQRVIVIVDVTQLRGTTWQQLADYLAVVSLAQIDPNADPSAFDSILNLFTNPAAYSGLTDWDLSYLKALYDIDQERIPQLQLNQVVSEMAERERAFDEPATP